MSLRPSRQSILQTYRKLLRAIVKYTAPQFGDDGNNKWRQIVVDEYRRNQHVKDANTIAVLHSAALNYKDSILETKEYERLCLQYGWGLPENQREKVRQTAARVGLRVEYGEEELREIEQFTRQIQQLTQEVNKQESEAPTDLSDLLSGIDKAPEKPQ
eukprot:TRINITY_DN42640_c0_g1_i1.p1 TRINITY_DN42640_c0_g1~~TRINITY_DN42640_c0_g1_i1.p1  ORF type:complete len:158 (-),score=38.41 TRINITY_DN42640_c0_g1_i1:154-627(-)